MRRFALAAAALIAAAGAVHAETITVQMSNVAFAPATINAKVGDTIVWNNGDIVAHTATARDKSWDLMVLPKKSASLTIKKAGSIEYYCKYHPNMVGHIEVKQ